MDFEELVQTRRSVRGFKQQPVPRAVIEAIMTQPSARRPR
jgi:nitroreductase